MHYIVGLGNPGEEYKLSRHNVGRIVVGAFMKFAARNGEISELKLNKKIKALVAAGEMDGEKFQIIFPETFMNKSGFSVKPLITSKKKAEKLIVVHDDIDLALGKYKISFGKGSGGHKGVESIMRAVKTKDFVRIRVGVSPSTPKGKLKKPKGEKMIDFIIGNFKPNESKTLTAISKKIVSALKTILKDGLGKAMSEYN